MIPTLFWAAAGWGLGILLYYLPSDGKIYLSLLFFTLCCWNVLKDRRGLTALIILSFLGLFWAWFDDVQNTSTIAEYIQDVEEVHIVASGKIDSHPVIDGDRLRFLLKARKVDFRNGDAGVGNVQINRSIEVKERIWVTIKLKSVTEKEVANGFARGDRITLPLELSLPTGPRNPGAFDFPHYLWSNYTTWTGKGEGLNQILSGGNGWQVGRWLGWRGLSELRTYLEVPIDSFFTQENAGILKGMLLGERVEVSAELEEVYQRTGILHVLAISGFHVMVVISGLLLLLQYLGITRERTYESLLLFIPFYIFLTGQSPSVTRAGMMGFLFLLAQRLRVGYSAWRAISIAFLIMTWLNPRALFHIGFQLSFTVTFGLIAFTQPVINKISERFPAIPKALVGAIAVPFVAQMVSFPILALNFHQVYLVSFFVNLLIMPLFLLIIPWGYVSLLLGLLLPPLGKWVAYPLNGLMELLHKILTLISQLPGVVISVATLPSWWLILYGIFFLILIWQPSPYMNILAWHNTWYARIRWGRWVTLIFLLLILFASLLYPYFQHEVRITFIDVGQGDSILIQGPKNRAILIDAGGVGYHVPKEEWQLPRNAYDVGKDVVVPTLRGLGVSKLDWIVLSHGDGDHIGGFKEVVNRIPVKHVLVNGVPPSTTMENDLIELIKHKGIPIYRVEPGRWLHFNDSVTWYILAGGFFLPAGKSGDNDASIVLHLSAYGRSVLFTGDLEAAGEEELIENWPELILPRKIDLLKVGHHGSKTSTTKEFLERINPELAVISVGVGNRFGHPAPGVIHHLEEQEIAIFRTDHLGAITFTIHKDGRITWRNWANE